ncbi:MAG: hypothetical protein EX272_03335 [Chromatiales bacterium]|nr:MAG: hypothetical protein EX272_03335 [Chromatiales bacterium]
MRYSALLLALVLLTGCTTSQVKEASGAVAGGLFEMALDIALDGPERRAKQRRRWEDNPANRWDACLPPCEITTDWQDRRAAAEREEEARRKQEREAREYEGQVNAIIDSLAEAERRSGQLQPEPALTDYEQQELERLQRRDEILEDWAEFDEFMQALETAEEQNNDPRLAEITGE